MYSSFDRHSKSARVSPGFGRRAPAARGAQAFRRGRRPPGAAPDRFRQQKGDATVVAGDGMNAPLEEEEEDDVVCLSPPPPTRSAGAAEAPGES